MVKGKLWANIFTEDFIVVIFAKTANGQTIRTSITLKIEDRG